MPVASASIYLDNAASFFAASVTNIRGRTLGDGNDRSRKRGCRSVAGPKSCQRKTAQHRTSESWVGVVDAREITGPVPERALERLSRYWVIERGEEDSEEGKEGTKGTEEATESVSARVFIIYPALELPVFVFREEAEIFLHFHRERHALKLKKIDSSGLLSLLLDPAREMKSVLLDPYPKELYTAMIPLRLTCDGFIDFIMARLEKRFKASAK